MKEVTYPTHQPSAIIPIDGAFSGTSYAANVALSPKKDGVHERLGPAKILQKKYRYTYKP